MNNTYTLTLTSSGIAGSSWEPTRTFQGPTNIIFNFTPISETTFNVVGLYVDYGDTEVLQRSIEIQKTFSDSDETVRIAESGKLSYVLDNVEHTYFPTNSAYITQWTTQIKLIYSNFNSYVFNIPIRLAQTSFFSEVGELNIKSTQFIDISSNKQFFQLVNNSGSVYSVRI